MRREDKHLRATYREIMRAGAEYRKRYTELAKRHIAELNGEKVHSVWVDHLSSLIEKEMPQALIEVKQTFSENRKVNTCREMIFRHPDEYDLTQQYCTKWRKLWKEKTYDTVYPRAPQVVYELKKLDNYHYEYGPFVLELAKESNRTIRYCMIYYKDMKLFSSFERAVAIRTGPGELIPFLRALTRLCDWNQFHTFTEQQRNAIGLRVRAVRTFYGIR